MAMDKPLRFIDLLVNHVDDVTLSLEQRDGAELVQLRETLLRLAPGAEPEVLEAAESMRRVERLHRGR